MAEDHSQEDLIREISRFLQYHDFLGIKEYPRSENLEHFLGRKKVPEPPRQAAKAKKDEGRKKISSEKKHLFDPDLAHRATLDDVRKEIGDCHRCSLDQTRTSIVYGQGPETAALMIIADAPANEDDRAGIPFQGETGELLDRMLKAISISREEVYITTLVKCFPGKDTGPDKTQIKTCLPFLFRQIEIICPRVIFAMGAQSSQVLLHSRKSLFQLRGHFYNFNDLCSSKLAEKITLMPSLHPSLLLENPELKKASWHDLQLVQKKLAE